MELLRETPDKFYELAIVSPLKFVNLVYEKIQRITDRKGRGIHGLRRPNIEGLCCVPERAGITIRRGTGYRRQAVKGAGKDNRVSSRNSTKVWHGIEGLYFQHKASREKQWQTTNGEGRGYIRPCLSGHKESGICASQGHAVNDKHTSRPFTRNTQGRARYSQFSKGQRTFKNRFKSKRDRATNRNRCVYCKQDAQGGVQAV